MSLLVLFTTPRTFSMPVETGTYTMTGFDVFLNRGYTLVVTLGTYVMNGAGVGLDWSGTPRTNLSLIGTRIGTVLSRIGVRIGQRS